MTDEIQYEYRPMYRMRAPAPNGMYYDDNWSEWKVITTYSGKGKPYSTIGGAKGVLTSQKKRNEKSRYNQDRGLQYEYKVQRRPVNDFWEDC